MPQDVNTGGHATDGADIPPAPPELTPIDSIAAPVNRVKGLRGVPRVAIDAIRVVNEAAPRTLRFAIVLQVLSAVFVGLQLYVVKGLVAGLIELSRDPRASISAVIPSFASLLALTVALGVAAALMGNQQRMLAERVGRRTMDRIIDVASSVTLSKFEEPTFFDQLERATRAGMFRPVEMVTALLALLLAGLTSIAILVALATLEPLLVPLVLAAGVPVLLATLRNSKQSYAFEYGMTTHARERLHLLELFAERDSAKELRVFGATPFLRRRYDALSDERISRMEVFLRGRLMVALVGTVAGAFGTGVALGSLVWLVATDRSDIATAAAAALAMQVLAARLTAVTASTGKLVESGMFLDDLATFLALEESAAPITATAGVPAEFHTLQVRDLSFSYPGTDREVLSGVDLDIRRGEVVAIVGENGSGKTTLVKILCQLYEHQHGGVRWNDTDVGDVPPEHLRANMTVLFQDFVRYHLTAAENVVLGRSDIPVDLPRVEDAARRAGAHEFIDQLPSGYDTRLGRQFLGGHELSGGQWQRLALARAFYRGGGFLIMDEPTAALDPRAEYALFQQIRDLAAGKSVLLISHRFANVRMADRIYVLERGRVVESGDHAALLRNDALYAELYRLQAAAYASEAK